MLEVGWTFELGLVLVRAGLEAVGFEAVDLEVLGLEAAFLERVALCLGKAEPVQVAPDLSFDQFAGPLDRAVVVELAVVGLGTAVAVVVGLDIAVVVAVDLGIAVAETVDLGIAVAEAADLGIAVAEAVDLGIAVAAAVDLDAAVAGLDTAAVGVDLARDIAVTAVGIVLAVPGTGFDAVVGIVPDAAGTVAVLDNLVELVGNEVPVLVDTVLHVPVGNTAVARTVDGHTCVSRGWLD